MKKIATLKPDSYGTSIFFLIVLLFGSFVFFYISVYVLAAYIMLVIFIWFKVLYNYVNIEFYENHLKVRRVLGKHLFIIDYNDIEGAKYVYGAGRGNVLFKMTFRKNEHKIKSASFSEAGLFQFRKIAKILKDKGVIFKVIPDEKNQHFWE